MHEDVAQGGQTRSLADVLGVIRDGDLSTARMSRLSDLSRDDARAFAAFWPSLSEEARAEIVRRLEALSEERVDLNFGRALRVAFDDPSPVVRQLAIGGLWEDNSSEWLDRLRVAMRDDPSPDVRAAAAAALEPFSSRAAVGSLGSDAATALRDELLRVVHDEDSAYAAQRRALETLGPFAGDPRVAASIVDAYGSGDHGLQCSAVYAMGRSLDAKWLPDVLAELEGADPELRFEAARAAGALGSSDALPALLAAARDEDPEVRHAAIAAIGQIGGRGGVRALERLADDAGEADLELIEAALEEANTMLEPFQQ